MDHGFISLGQEIDEETVVCSLLPYSGQFLM